MLRRLTALLGVVALIVAGCGFFSVPSKRYTITVGGMERSYRLYKPPNLPNPAPLVVVLHALGANTVNAEQTMGWDKRADIDRFLVAYPEGIGWTWNAHGCCGKAAEVQADDVGFITTMIDRVPGVDRSRIYVTGLSNGGVMAYTLACNTDIFAAIGPVEATQIVPCPNPHPTSVMHIHGLADDVVKFGGTPKSERFPVDGPPVADVIAFWRRVNRCEPPVVTEAGPQTVSTATCPDNREVVLVTFDDVGHAWPRSAEVRLWDFFAAHPK